MESSSSNEAPPTTGESGEKVSAQNKPNKCVPLSNAEIFSLLKSGNRAALNTPDQDGNTPLLTFIARNNSLCMYWIVEELVDAGADVTAVNKKGDCAFKLAFKKQPNLAFKIVHLLARANMAKAAIDKMMKNGL